jgi:hypothetical protein
MTDDKAAEACEHLQAAALELIAAARSFLDVAEDLVRDPAAAATIVSAAAGAGRAVFGTANRGRTAEEPQEDTGKVRRIHVS